MTKALERQRREFLRLPMLSGATLVGIHLFPKSHSTTLMRFLLTVHLARAGHRASERCRR